jgi:hypothetical protein
MSPLGVIRLVLVFVPAHALPTSFAELELEEYNTKQQSQAVLLISAEDTLLRAFES